MSEPKKIGSGADLTLYNTANLPGESKKENANKEQFKKQSEDKYHDPGYQNDDYKTGNESYEDDTYYEDDFDSSNDYSKSTRNPQSEKERKEIYDKYKESFEAISGSYAHKAKFTLLQKSGAMKIDIVKGAMDIKLIADASGLVVATRHLMMKNALKNISDEESRRSAAALMFLSNKGKIKPGQFTDDEKGYRSFKKILDKEILSQTGVDISKMSSKHVANLMSSGKLNRIITPNNNSSSIITMTGVSTELGNLSSLVGTSVMLERHFESLKKIKNAKGAQKRSIWRLTDRLMGEDVDLWNGMKYVRKKYKSVKRIVKTVKKLKRIWAPQSSATRSSSSTIFGSYRDVPTKDIVTATTKTNMSSTSANTARLSKTASETAKKTKPFARALEKSSRLIAKWTGRSAATSGLTTSGALTASGTTASAGAAGASAAGGAGAAGSAGAGGAGAAGAGGAGATGGGALALIWPILLIVLIVLLIIILVVCVTIIGSVMLNGFENNRNNASDPVENVAPTETLLYKTYDLLKVKDNELKKSIENGISPDQAEKLSINIYEEIANSISNQNPLTGETVIIEPVKTDSGYVNIAAYDESGNRIAFFKTNAREILCAATVFVGNDSENCPQTFKKYAENLWEDTHQITAHTVKDENGKIAVNWCSNAECSHSFIFTVISTPDGSGNSIETKYFVESINGNEITFTDALVSEITNKIARGNLFGYESPDGKSWSIFSGEFKNGYHYRFCAGHVNYEIGIITSYLEDGNTELTNSSFFSKDSITNNPEQADYWNSLPNEFTKLNKKTKWDGSEFVTYKKLFGLLDKETVHWDGWTEDNKETVSQFYSGDWYELYGISFAESGLGGETLDDSQIKDIIDFVNQDSNKQAAQVVKFALGTVGKIPYYWGGKQNVSEMYGAHANMSVSNFLATYYPHLGTQKVSTQNGQPVSINGWYGCGGIDSKRSIIGLDCSGFISFVYNNYGISVGAGTGGLSTTGTAVDFNNLKPGDIMINDPYGPNGHVVMFVKWDNDSHTSYTTVESAGSSGVVMRSGRTEGWYCYRRIIQ